MRLNTRFLKKKADHELPIWDGDGRNGIFPGYEPGGRISKVQMMPIENLHPTETVYEDQVQQLEQAFLADDDKPIPAIIVEDAGNGQFDIIDGHHRYQAAKNVGYKEVPVRVWTSPDDLRAEKTAAKDSNDLIRAQDILTEMMGTDVMPGLPMPNLKIVNHIKSTWNGRCTWQPPSTNIGQANPKLFTGGGQQTTLIELQKSICHDETTLRKIIAHELCHHEQFLGHFKLLSPAEYRAVMRVEGGHGKTWLDIAARWNAKYGANFVTKTSDETHIVQHDEKPFYILLWKSKQGMRWQIAVNLTPKALRSMWSFSQIREKDGDAYKLCQIIDRDFIKSAGIGTGSWSYSLDPQIMQKAEIILETGENIFDQTVENRFTEEKTAPFFVLLSSTFTGKVMWQQATSLNIQQKRLLASCAHRVKLGISSDKLVMSTSPFLKSGARIGSTRWSWPRVEEEAKATSTAWNEDTNILDEYLTEGKTASPDFGYSEFNDRDEELDQLEWREYERYGGFGFAAHGAGMINIEMEGDRATVRLIDIEPDWRSTGLGQILYEKAIAEAAYRGATILRSDTRRSRAAEKAWERLSQRYQVTRDPETNQFVLAIPPYVPKYYEPKIASPDFGYSEYNGDKENWFDYVTFEGGFSGNYLSITAIYNDDIEVGFIHCYGNGDTCSVDEVGIGKAWRGTGLGQMLYDAAIDEAKKKGYTRFSSDKEMRPDAHSAWKRLSQRYPVVSLKNNKTRPHESDVLYNIDLNKVQHHVAAKTATDAKLMQAVEEFRSSIEEDEEWWDNKACFKGQCSDISKLLVDFLKTKGFPAITRQGYFDDLDDDPKTHWWVEVGNTIIDVTADQFYPGEEDDFRIVVTEKGDERYIPLTYDAVMRGVVPDRKSKKNRY